MAGFSARSRSVAGSLLLVAAAVIQPTRADSETPLEVRASAPAPLAASVPACACPAPLEVRAPGEAGSRMPRMVVTTSAKAGALGQGVVTATR